MRFSLVGLLRVALLFVGASGVLAWSIGRTSVEGSAAHVERRVASNPPVNLSRVFFDTFDTTTRWLDPATGSVRVVKLPQGEQLDFASCAPWVDEEGEAPVVGRWMRKTTLGSNGVPLASGILMMKYPSGTIVERIETDVIPVGRPCWLPDDSDRVVFAGGEGTLHLLDLSAPEGYRRPSPITWRIPTPGAGPVFITDPCVAGVPGPEGIDFIACLRSIEKRDGRSIYTPSRLWWLRLDRAATSVIEAAPLVETARGTLEIETRCPTVKVLADGTRRLAYCRRTNGRDWELRTADLERNPSDGGLFLLSEGRALLDSCFATPPAFSPDGRRVTTMRGEVFKTCELVSREVEPRVGGLAAAGPAAPGF
ncbi:MAG: hypothetical protein SFX72_05500 [Isosphaeraceae bacterium]|nr:hypothetical protein [Isosphaeraceae bacterium]